LGDKDVRALRVATDALVDGGFSLANVVASTTVASAVTAGGGPIAGIAVGSVTNVGLTYFTESVKYDKWGGNSIKDEAKDLVYTAADTGLTAQGQAEIDNANAQLAESQATVDLIGSGITTASEVINDGLTTLGQYESDKSNAEIAASAATVDLINSGITAAGEAVNDGLAAVGQAEIDNANAEIEASRAFVGQVLDAGQQAWSAVTNFFTPTAEETATLLSTNNTDSETVKLSASA